MKEDYGGRAKEEVEIKNNLQIPLEMKIVKDSVKSLMKRGIQSKIKGRKSKEEKEQDNKEQIDKQRKKEENERRKKEDKKRKLHKRYERVMMEQELEEIDVSGERYLQSYREREKRFEKLESSGRSSSSNGRFVEGLLTNADITEGDSEKPRRRAVSIAWDDTSVGNNNINGAKASRMTKLLCTNELKSAIEGSRRSSLNALKTMKNGCKAKQDYWKVTDNTQRNSNCMDEERMKRIVEMFAAKEHNAAVLKGRSSKANAQNSMGNVASSIYSAQKQCC